MFYFTVQYFEIIIPFAKLLGDVYTTDIGRGCETVEKADVCGRSRHA